MPAIKDITGEQYGRLVAVKFAGLDSAHKALWVCDCACGNQTTVRGGNLQNGSIISCGCAKSERARTIRLAHGDKRTKRRMIAPEYKVWDAMKQRCCNPRSASFARYGGRGIAVCAEWLDNYPAFLKAVGRRPSQQHSLDRYPNNNGNYEPNNVRWATPKQQANNRNKAVREKKRK